MRRSLWSVALGLGLALGAAPAAAQEGALPEAAGDVSPEQVLQQAEGFVKKREYAKAESAYNEVLTRDPKQAAAWAGLAKVYHRNKRWKEAADLLERGRAELGTSWAEGAYLLAYTQRKAGKPKEAIALYQAYLQLVSDDPDGVFGLAASFEEAGQPAEAREAYARYIQVEKRPSEQKWVEKARERVEALQAAAPAPQIKIANPEAAPPPAEAAAPPADADPAALRRQGEDAFAAKAWDKAAAAWTAAADADPNDWETRYKLGVARALLGDLPGAVQAWEAALALNPKLRVAQDRIHQAQAKLAAQSEGGADDPRLTASPEERLALAQEYLQAQRWVMALRAADAALEARPDDGAAHHARGLALMGLARYDEAEAALESALGARPGDGAVMLALGQCALQRGDTPRARWMLRRGLDRLDPTAAAYPDLRAVLERLDAVASTR